MPHGYKIIITFVGGNANKLSKQTLFVQIGNAELTAILQVLNASPAISDISVFSTINIPSLHQIAKLTRVDLGLSEDSLGKIK